MSHGTTSKGNSQVDPVDPKAEGTSREENSADNTFFGSGASWTPGGNKGRMGNKSSTDPTSYDVTTPDPQDEEVGSDTAGGSSPKKASKKAAGKEEKVADPVEQQARPVRQVVADFTDLKDGEMKEVQVSDKTVLLARDQGAYYAVSAKCTHYGASLVKGALCNGRVRCPWHGACFNLATGDIEDFPGLDSLQSYDVEVTDGKVSVVTDTVQLASTKRIKSMIPRDLECTLLYLIIGGGPAAMECAETLRQGGYKGKILIMAKEYDLPYDRPKLSKAMTSSGEELALRPKEFFSVYDIKYMLGMEAFEIDTEMNHAIFKGGVEDYTDYTVEYDQAVICTGSRPCKLAVTGAPTFKKDVFYLRTPGDANDIASRAKDSHVVVVGTSYIGMEVAAYLASKARSVTVIGRGATPFSNTLGERIGTVILNLFLSKGVKFQLGTEVEELIGNEESLTTVKLKNGESIPADILVVGIGVQPNTDWLAKSSIERSRRGHVIVNKYNKTNVDNVYAAGDCTSFPLFMSDDQPVNIGHFQMSLAAGKGAGLAMCSKEEPLRSVPFFWCSVFGKSIRYCGYGSPKDEVVFHGDDSHFIAFFIRDEKVVAVASLNEDPMVTIAAELMHAEVAIPAAGVRDDPSSIKKLLENVNSS